VEPHFDRAKTIVINFPAFVDGRGFSLAKLLRRKGFEGELIAEGPLIPDQYAFAIQCGFNAVKLDEALLQRHGESHWFNALSEFGLTYQRGYAVASGPATSVLDARKTGFRTPDNDDGHHGLSAEQSLKKAIEAYEGQIVLASSLGVDSAVLLHMVSKINPDLPIVFLDTGKHFRETLAYRDMLVEDLGLTNFQNIRPDPKELAEEDPKGDLNKTEPDMCCGLRKVRPLDRVINQYAARITGRKRYQTPQRANMPILETGGDQVKVNPLAYWSAKDVTDYMRRHDLPPHPMLTLGYLSIGTPSAPLSPKQDTVPSWQVGPTGLALTKSVSWSQSISNETSSKIFPLVSPFVQSFLRERLKNVTFFVSKVFETLSADI